MQSRMDHTLSEEKRFWGEAMLSRYLAYLKSPKFTSYRL